MKTLRPLFALAAVASVASAHALNIVLNPGFETGDFTSWNQAGGAVLRDDPHTGTYEASFSPAAGTLSQGLTTTTGTLYTISFYLRNAGTAAGGFVVALGGSTLVNIPNAPVGSYQFYTYTATATATTSPLTFTFPNPHTTFHLDDVTVEAVPEPASFAALSFGALGLLHRRRRKA